MPFRNGNCVANQRLANKKLARRVGGGGGLMKGWLASKGADVTLPRPIKSSEITANLGDACNLY